MSASAELRVFQEGVGGWTGTFDRIVAGDGTAVDGSGVSDYLLDGDPVAATIAEDRNLLLRFDGLFGPGPIQIPAGAEILSARLVLRTLNPSTGPYVIGQLDQAVGPATSYADLEELGFPGARGAVLRPVAAGFTEMKETEIVTADLTEIVRNWKGGAPNHGVAIYSSYTSDSWGVVASGHPEPTLRPRLEIEFTTAPTTRLQLAPSRGVQLDSEVGFPSRDLSGEVAMRIDAQPGSIQEVLMAFDDLFGEGPGQIGDGETILRADLVFTTLQQAEFPGPPTDSLDFFGVFPMTTGWDLTDADMNGFPDVDFGPTGPNKAADQIADVVSEFGGVGEDSRARADVTELVKAWRAGLPNHGVNVKMTSLESDGWVITAPGAGGANTPFLEIVTTTAPTPPEEGVVELRQGVDGYDGTFQMGIDLGDGRRLPVDFPSYTLDGEPPTEDANDLLRFDGLIGTSDGQVPPGATILSARLEYSTAGSSVSSGSEGVYALAALAAPVDASTLYSSLSTGPGFEGVRGIAGKRVGGFSQMVTGERVGADVSAIVQDWANGTPNHGFGVFPGESTDGWELCTTGDVIARRPSLRVEYATTPVTRLVVPAGEVAVMEVGDVTGDGFAAGFAKVDGDPDIRILLGFDSLLDPGQLDPGAEVLRAWLIADTGDLGGDSGIGPVSVEPMAVDWSVASVFSDFGGDGPDTGDGETTGVAGRFFGMGLDSECRLDLTEVVRAWQDGSLSNEGLMLRAETDDSWWMHMPGGDPARAPRLEILIAVASGYDDYVSGLGQPGLARDDDGDGDGLPALVEYGLGLDPDGFDPRPGLVAVPGGLRLEFAKGAEAKLDPAIQYDIEGCDDLVSWQSLGAAVDETSDTIGVTISPSGRGFYRLVVTEE